MSTIAAVKEVRVAATTKADGVTSVTFPPSIAETESHRGQVSLDVLTDIVCLIELAIVIGVALISKFLYIDLYLSKGEISQAVGPYATTGCLGAFLVSVAFRQLKLYQPKRLAARQMGAGRLMLGLALAFLAILGVLYFLKIGQDFSRGWMLCWFGVAAGTLLFERKFIQIYAQKLVAEGRIRERVAVYGFGDIGNRVSQILGGRSTDAELAGYFDAASDTPTGGESTATALDRLIDGGRDNRFDRVIIALPQDQRHAIPEIVSRLGVLPVEVECCTDVVHLPIAMLGSRLLGPLQLVGLQRRPISARGRMLKSVIDFVLSIAGLLVLSPLFLLVAIAIKVDSHGPIFFVQRRHGFNNNVIHVIKFRTMTCLEDGPDIRQVERNDERVTRVGRILRRTSIDELPQLLNVLAGDMSLVGPRPHAVAHNEQFAQVVERYFTRHRVKPGVTGLAQVAGYRGEIANVEQLRRRLEHDIRYIETWSPWLDVEIMIRTIIIVITGRNAH